jgi:hypothetical protein
VCTPEDGAGDNGREAPPGKKVWVKDLAALGTACLTIAGLSVLILLVYVKNIWVVGCVYCFFRHCVLDLCRARCHGLWSTIV